MTKTATKVLATMSACALCAVMTGGVAYAITPDETPVAPQTAQASQTLVNAYDNAQDLMEMCGAE